LFERVRECLEEDVGNIFKQAHIRNRPDANFSAIALARFSGKSWEDISAEFGIPLPTLSRFFQRSCEKFRSQFRQYL
jgi:DNA-directed RNA polymerase specialized sigma24 family protein